MLSHSDVGRPFRDEAVDDCFFAVLFWISLDAGCFHTGTVPGVTAGMSSVLFAHCSPADGDDSLTDMEASLFLLPATAVDVTLLLSVGGD